MSENTPDTPGMKIEPELVPEMPDAIKIPAPIRIYSESVIMDTLRLTQAELREMGKQYNTWVSGGETYFRAEDLMQFQVDRFNRMISPGDSSEG